MRVSLPAAAVRRAVPATAVGLLLLGLAFVVRLISELSAAPAVDGHHDILAFWAAGRLILDGRPELLYDATAVTALQRTVIPEPVGMNGYMPFINPPPAAVVFAPIAALPVAAGRIAWAVISAALALAAGLWLGRGLPARERVLAAALVATSFPVYHALAEGQWSILLLGGGLVALEAVRRERWTVAGLALATFWLKPQFIVLPLLGLALGRRWRAVAAAVGAGVVVAGVTLPLVGPGPYLTYATYLLDVVASHFTGAGEAGAEVWQGDLASTEGLNGLLVGWLGQGAVAAVNVLWAAGVLAIVGVYALAARRVPPGTHAPEGRMILAAGVAVMLLVNPNQFVQDCVLVFLILDTLGPLRPASRLSAIVATVAVADLTFIDQLLPALHLFPIAMLFGVAYVCRRALGRRSATPAALPGGDAAVSPS